MHAILQSGNTSMDEEKQPLSAKFKFVCELLFLILVKLISWRQWIKENKKNYQKLVTDKVDKTNTDTTRYHQKSMLKPSLPKDEANAEG
ncbi:hypothetical protein NPIL_449091 [Nephila pilipes]|uniref:Uncharacterized protein n=1 Tax=Nephila pilipes TaxID=299642 RepID=A0A8X6QRD4_NEPPI|nr:hypothetical protein NPIL_449091 [Nephila pilipes]